MEGEKKEITQEKIYELKRLIEQHFEDEEFVDLESEKLKEKNVQLKERKEKLKENEKKIIQMMVSFDVKNLNVKTRKKKICLVKDNKTLELKREVEQKPPEEIKLPKSKLKIKESHLRQAIQHNCAPNIAKKIFSAAENSVKMEAIEKIKKTQIDSQNNFKLRFSKIKDQEDEIVLNKPSQSFSTEVQYQKPLPKRKVIDMEYEQGENSNDENEVIEEDDQNNNDSQDETKEEQDNQDG